MWIVIAVIWVYIFVKAHETIYFKCVHFVTCKLYLNKVDFKNTSP